MDVNRGAQWRGTFVTTSCIEQSGPNLQTSVYVRLVIHFALFFSCIIYLSLFFYNNCQIVMDYLIVSDSCC